MKRAVRIVFAVSVLWTNVCFAAEFPAQARLFAGVTNSDPTNLNQELKAQGLEEFKQITKFGVEITYPLTKLLDVGINYTKRSFTKGALDTTTSYQSSLDQDCVQLIARVPFVQTDFVRLDVFGGVGGSNTTFSLKSATQDGQLTRREANDWFASPYMSYGTSLALGYKNFFVVFEGGFESNKVDNFKRSGNLNDNIQTLDLSGNYFSVGLLFNGITARSK